MLSENANIMKSRIDQVADPDVSQFNIAMPKKDRLAIFESICPEVSAKEAKKANKKANNAKQNKSKFGQNKQRNTSQRLVTFIKKD